MLPANADIPLILSRIRSGADWGWKGGSTADPTNLVWRDAVQTAPTFQELEAEWTAIVTENATADTVRQQLKTAYAPLVGRDYSTLTNAELRTMSQIHSYILGGINETTGLLKPANQWTIAKELLKA